MDMEKAWSHSDEQDSEQFLKNKAREDKPQNKKIFQRLPDAGLKILQLNKYQRRDSTCSIS
jgi:hypothetical protein